MLSVAETFSARIKRRYGVWWGPVQARGIDGLRQRLHRRTEYVTYRDRRDPDDRWRCCQYWQRTLANKWNSRQFALRHGCRVPDLYWSGRRVGRIPFDSLPDRYVIKPIYGHSRRNVHLMDAGLDLARGASFTKTELRTHLIDVFGRIARIPFLVEEFIRSEQGDYRFLDGCYCHVFGNVVGAVQVIERAVDMHQSKHGFYTAQWKLLDGAIHEGLLPGHYKDPPGCLDEILACARTLGKAYGTYVRIDLYASDRGCVFGEFSPTPFKGERVTPYADEYFGALWNEHVGDRI